MKIGILTILMVFASFLKGVAQGPCSEPLEIKEMPNIYFKPKSSNLTIRSMKVLDSIVYFLMCNPPYKLTLNTRNKNNALAWKRINNTIKYLTEEKGLPENRFTFAGCQGDIDDNLVELAAKPYINDQPIIPAPHPNLKKKSD